MEGCVPLPSPATLRRLAAHAVRVRTQATDIPSPCINVCRIDPLLGLCSGCYRTMDEIAAWGQSDDNSKRQTWARIAERLTPKISLPETP